MAQPHDSPRLRKLILGTGAAGMVAAAVFGGYRYAAREPADPMAGAAPLTPAARPSGPPLCAGAARIPGASGAVCQRPVAPAKGALP